MSHVGSDPTILGEEERGVATALTTRPHEQSIKKALGIKKILSIS